MERIQMSELLLLMLDLSEELKGNSLNEEIYMYGAYNY